MNKLFKDLSAKLCADEHLSSGLADEYYLIISQDPNLEPLLNAYKLIVDSNPSDLISEIQKQLLVNQNFKVLIREIIKLWYLGKSDRTNVTELRSGEHYFHYEALIWKVIHAHPSGLTGGYFGYWAYKPEN